MGGGEFLKFPAVLRVLPSITKTLKAAYLLKTGNGERAAGGEKKVSESSVYFLVHREGLLKELVSLHHPQSSNTFRPLLPPLVLIGQASKFPPQDSGKINNTQLSAEGKPSINKTM